MSRSFKQFAAGLACLATVTFTLHDVTACGGGRGGGGGGGYGGGYGGGHGGGYGARAYGGGFANYARPQQAYPYNYQPQYPSYPQVAHQPAPLPQNHFSQPQPRPQQQGFAVQQASAQVAQAPVRQAAVAQAAPQGQFAAPQQQGGQQLVGQQQGGQQVNVQRPIVNQQPAPQNGGQQIAQNVAPQNGGQQIAQNVAPQNAAPANVAPQNVAPQQSAAPQTIAPQTAPAQNVAPLNQQPQGNAQPANPSAPANDSDGSALQALLGSNVTPSASTQSESADAGSLTGSYVASLSNATVRLTLNADGTFLWQANKDGKASSFQGQYSQQNGSLVLSRSDNQKLEGLMGITSSGFTLRVGQSDTSLSFVRG